MKYRKPYKRIADTFKMLLREGDRERLQSIVDHIDADWYDVVAIVFTMGLDQWEHQTAAALAEDNAAQAAQEAADGNA